MGLQRHRGQPRPSHLPASRAKQGKNRSHRCFLWYQPVGRRDVTEETKADTVRAQALQDYPGGEGAAGTGAALVPLPFRLSSLTRTHLLPFLTSGPQRPRPNSGDRAEDLCLKSGVSHLQKPVQTYQALAGECSLLLSFMDGKIKMRCKIQSEQGQTPLCIVGWGEVQCHTRAPHTARMGTGRRGMQIALLLGHSIRIIKPNKSSPPPSLA